MKKTLIILFMVMACNNGEKLDIRIEERFVLDAIPSGSGMVIYKGFAYIISDDAPWLFKLSLATKQYSSIRLGDSDTSIYRISKPVKPDYEALCSIEIGNKAYMLAFGSGSLAATRDTLLVISLDDPGEQQKIPLTLFYNGLRAGNTIINIEGAVSNAKDLFLMDRYQSKIYQVSIASMIELIQSNGERLPSGILVHPVTIPGAANARISGGCLLDDTTLLYCASVEDTPDAVADGRIHGSYFGLIDLKSMKPGRIASLTDVKGIALPDKIESIDIAEKHPGGYKLWAMADNDDGRTVLFTLRLALQKQ